MKTWIADDFTFINQRLKELKGNRSQDLFNNTNSLDEIDPTPVNHGGKRLTDRERLIVAEAFGCQWHGHVNNNEGCGNSNGKICLRQGKCDQRKIKQP